METQFANSPLSSWANFSYFLFFVTLWLAISYALYRSASKEHLRNVGAKPEKPQRLRLCIYWDYYRGRFAHRLMIKRWGFWKVLREDYTGSEWKQWVDTYRGNLDVIHIPPEPDTVSVSKNRLNRGRLGKK